MRTLLTGITILLTTTILRAQATGTIKGTVTDAISNAPIGFASVGIEGTTLGAFTEDDGTYELPDVPPGVYTVTVSYLGYRDASEYEVLVNNSRPVVVDFKLETASEELAEVEVFASPFRKTEESPVSLRSIGVTEIRRNPGGARDISKVIQTLPGVTSTASFRNDLIIRGGAPNENRFFIDDIEIPNINHFATQGASGGPVGLINVNFIREVDFYSGAFPTNRGNALSSVFDFKFRDGRDDRFGSVFTVGASDVGLALEGPLGDKTTYILSARRSYLQFLFSALGLPFLPTYNDFQIKTKTKIDSKNEITFLGIGAIDDFELNLDANETEEQRFQLANLPVNTQWNYANGVVYKHYQDNSYWTVVLSRNMLNNEAIKYRDNDESDADNLILDYKSQEIENKLRIERTTRTGGYKINYGVGYQYVKYNNRTFNRIFTSQGPQEIDFASDVAFSKYALFGQVSKKYLDERLVLSLGTRFDGATYNGDMRNPLSQFSPRFSASYALSPDWSVNFNTGIYTQLPAYTVLGYREGGALVNQERLTYITNRQVVAGVEWNTAASSKVSLEGYFKYYTDYPFLLRDSLNLANLGGDFGIIGNEPTLSQAAGRTYGLEFLYQQRLYKGFYGIASYTLGWSEFEDKNGDYIPSAWDARHIGNATIGRRFKGDWEVGVNFRVQTGQPFTPFSDQSSLVLNWDVNNRGIPDYDLLNTERTRPFYGLDIRVDKKWFFKNFSLNAYIDVENLVSQAPITNDLILDRPLDENGTPIGPGIIDNPNDPIAQQRYRLKAITDATATRVPTIGLEIEI